MSIRGFDHWAITVEDIDTTLRFYQRVLGASSIYEDLWRKGEIPVVLMQLGENRMSVHSAAAPAAPHARVPTPGSGDLCFRWDGPIAGAVDPLRAQRLEIVDGPVPRPAADGSQGQSVYFRDPDGNLLEFLTTDG